MSEISYSVNKVCQYMHNPLESYWVVVKHILRYLVGTLDHGLYLQRPSNLNLIGFCDSDLATDRDDKRSTSGFCMFLGLNLVSWQSKKQQIITRSTVEVKYMIVANLAAEMTWLRSSLSKFQITLQFTPIV